MVSLPSNSNPLSVTSYNTSDSVSYFQCTPICCQDMQAERVYELLMIANPGTGLVDQGSTCGTTICIPTRRQLHFTYQMK